MVIIGTGGLAKDLVGSLARDFRHKNFYFYNDRSDCLDELFVNRYPIIKSKVALIEHFTNLYADILHSLLAQYHIVVNSQIYIFYTWDKPKHELLLLWYLGHSK